MKIRDYCIITTTLPNEQTASIMIKTLLQKRLVACVQSYTIKSHYHWQGNIENSNEVLLQCKTKKILFDEIKSEIERNHPYEIPEIIMIELQGANDAYLAWIDDETIKEKDAYL
jgi:periplasmic divalent cation tolerance protein